LEEVQFNVKNNFSETILKSLFQLQVESSIW